MIQQSPSGRARFNLKLAGLYSCLDFPVKAIAVYKQALKTEAAPVEVHLRLCQEYQKLKMKREEFESLEIAFTEDELEECLRDLDFIVLQQIFSDARDLLVALKAKVPNNRRVLSCIQAVGQLLGSDLLDSHLPENG